MPYSNPIARLLFLALLPTSLAQNYPGVPATLASRCPGALATATNVACVSHYAAVLPPSSSRARSTDYGPSGGSLPNDTFAQTDVPGPSFELVRNASFVVLDPDRGGQSILGASPSLERIFDMRNSTIYASYEAPVYIPALNAIIYSILRGGEYQQRIINLNGSNPTMANYTTSPPVYGVTGARLVNGSVYWTAAGGYPFPNPDGSGIVYQKPGLYKLDPVARTVEILLNNYFGQNFNSPDDLVVEPTTGDIFFTDPFYGYYGINITLPPVLPAATWRFRPSTGLASPVDTNLQQPNGVALSPSAQTLYVTDTGETAFFTPTPTHHQFPWFTYNPTGGRSISAFDVSYTPAGLSYLTNRRTLYVSSQADDDGLHVAANGYIVAAEGAGVAVLSPDGEPLLYVQTDSLVINVQFAGPNLSELWLFGPESISRVRWALRGLGNE